MDKYTHPTQFTGTYPDWAGFTWLDWDAPSNSFHPGDDYNKGPYGDSDLGQPVYAVYKWRVVHCSRASSGYGNMVVLEHNLTQPQKDFIKQKYNITTNQVYSLYAHLTDYNVSIGNTGERGALIGRLGKTGNAGNYAHLHCELYAPIGEMAALDWRFYPIGWTKARIQKYWLPIYSFIEDWNKKATEAPLTDTQKVNAITKEIQSGNSDGDKVSHCKKLLGLI